MKLENALVNTKQVCLAVLAIGFSAASALGQPGRVEIVGGADDSGQNYSWTVTNRHDAPITFIEFPHFRADTFMVPPGWVRESTNLARAGATPKPGVCRATADEGASIAPKASAVFRMRISRAGALRRAGPVTVHFADGSQTVVSGVELPTRKSFGERYVMIVGLSVIFAVFLIVQIRRKRAADQTAPPATDA